MTYQKVTGPLMANSHPGSYCGQDAYSDMLVVDDDLLRRKRSTRPITSSAQSRCAELYARSAGIADFTLGGEPLEKQNNDVTVMSSNKGNFGISDDGTSTTLTSQEKDRPIVNENYSTLVRRLTPLECERLQGFPDNWTLIGKPEEIDVKDYDIKYDEDGNVVEKTLIGTHKEIAYFYTDDSGKKKKVADSARYKALGNSICTPFWKWLARRICSQYERDVTMGSLFDGIGGFPLVFEQCGAKAVWASEIEEFPMAVTKARFPEDE